MLFGTKKDLAALRAGIREQVHQELIDERSEESLERSKASRYVDSWGIVKAKELQLDDVLVGTNNGYTWRAAGEVKKLDFEKSSDGRKVREGTLWMEVEGDGHNYGRAMKLDQPVMVARGEIHRSAFLV